jgi:hypothetical protein
MEPLFDGKSGKYTVRDTFYYYFKNQLEGVRHREWKLHVRRREEEVRELYNLDDDIGEEHNLYDSHPEVVRSLESKLEECRNDLGDEAVGVAGSGCRPCGIVEHPEPLTEYDENHPYIIAIYDLEDAG